MKYLFFTTVLLFMLSACDENTTEVQDTEKEEEEMEEYLIEVISFQNTYPACDTTWFYPDSFKMKYKNYCDAEIVLDTTLTYEEIDSFYSEDELYEYYMDFNTIKGYINIDSISKLDSMPYEKFGKPVSEGVERMLFVTNKRSKFIDFKWFQSGVIPHLDSIYHKSIMFRNHFHVWRDEKLGD